MFIRCCQFANGSTSGDATNADAKDVGFSWPPDLSVVILGAAPTVSKAPALKDADADFLYGGGEMGALVRAMDWAKTPLGRMQDWPQSLRTAVSLCISSNFPISLAWGPKHVQIYNDGYRPICATKHPHSMGQDFTECWASAWSGMGEAFERALAGHAAYLEDQRMFLDRLGYLEETFFTFSFSPIRDETGAVGGLFHPVTEMTSKILSERRVRALRDLADQTGKARNLDDVFQFAAQALAGYALDLPFVLIYQITTETSARLAAGSGLPPGTAASPERIDLKLTTKSGWKLTEAMAGRASSLGDLRSRFRSLRCGPYPESPEMAVLLPLMQPGVHCPIGVLIAGVSTRLPMNEMYRTFLDQVASALTTSIANVRTYEAERHRVEALAAIDTARTQFFSNMSNDGSVAPLSDVSCEVKTSGPDLPADVAMEIVDCGRNGKADETSRLVVEAVPCAIVMVDQGGEILLVNRQTERLFGYPRDELIGRKVEVLVPERFRARHFGHRAQYAAQPQAIDLETRVMAPGNDLWGRRKDGSEFPVEIGLTTIETDEGSCVLSSIMDVTHLRVADETARGFNEALERQVAERTAQLVAMNKDLDEFAYAAAHDLKAPLRVIANASKWLEEDLQAYLSEETQENMKLVRSRVMRMDRLLDDLLDYSRIGRIGGIPDSEIVSGSELMEGILALLSLPESFEVKVSPDFAAISVDRMPLQHVLLNLVSNAYKHHDKPAGHIDVTVKDCGEHYAFSVRDDGPGIPAEFHERVFGLFQTLKPRDLVEGSGMGLAMVRKYVDTNGGTVTLESSEGSGSRFGFTWPKRNRTEGNRIC